MINPGKNNSLTRYKIPQACDAEADETSVRKTGTLWILSKQARPTDLIELDAD